MRSSIVASATRILQAKSSQTLEAWVVHVAGKSDHVAGKSDHVEPRGPTFCHVRVRIHFKPSTTAAKSYTWCKFLQSTASNISITSLAKLPGHDQWLMTQM